MKTRFAIPILAALVVAMCMPGAWAGYEALEGTITIEAGEGTGYADITFSAGVVRDLYLDVPYTYGSYGTSVTLYCTPSDEDTSTTEAAYELPAGSAAFQVPYTSRGDRVNVPTVSGETSPLEIYIVNSARLSLNCSTAQVNDQTYRYVLVREY